MARSKHKRPFRKTFFVVLDGKTEIWYLRSMKDYEGLSGIKMRLEISKKKGLRELYGFVVDKLNKPFDKVIWLVDLDVIRKENKVAEFNGYVKKLERNKGAVVLVNNPCLEFWFLLHFKNTDKLFSNCGSVERELKKAKRMPDYKKSKDYYRNRKTNIYERLRPLQETAINRAKKLKDNDIAHAKAEMYKLLEIFGIS